MAFMTSKVECSPTNLKEFHHHLRDQSDLRYVELRVWHQLPTAWKPGSQNLLDKQGVGESIHPVVIQEILSSNDDKHSVVFQYLHQLSTEQRPLLYVLDCKHCGVVPFQP
jgi:hypothetical protein